MKIQINDNQVKYQTAKAFLIKIPNSDLGFWLTSKLVFPYYDGYTLFLHEDLAYMTSKLHSRSREKGEIDGQSLIDAFANTKVLPPSTEPQRVEHIPEHKDPIKKRVIDNDLIRDPEPRNSKTK